MGEAEEFRKALISIAKKVKQKLEMTEGDVYSCFVDEGFFRALDYGVGIDARAQERIGAQYADYDCVDDIEQSIFILEAKKPAEQDLLAYRDKQLKEKYVLPKKSRYGVLTNGHTFYLFKREGERLIDELKIEDLASITEKQALGIYSRLKKPAYEYTDLQKTLAEISKIEVKSLAEEINRDSFYEIFKLKQEETGRPTKFTMLVFKLMVLFDELMHGEKSQFLEGAYKFWERSYAHKPSKLPENWRKLQKLMSEYEEKGDEALYKFMFCLETAHNIVAKLILAKVAEDVGFKNVSASEKLRSYMSLKFGEARITYIAYPFAIKETFDSLRYSLVESIFEEDIFDWWQDCSLRVGSNVQEWRSRDNASVRFFGEALARLFFALRSFDFRGLREDILGELYQHYFDPETRKALGEFYTPIEVVDYILDAVEYKGEKVLNQRLLDPACGSGTFIVEALKRYLHAAEARVKQKGEAHWSIILRDLCERPKIIGFDINPFARLMAQMRFMMETIPYYSRAQRADSSFVLTTIPIFRTDSLEIETKTGMLQDTLDKAVAFSLKMPVLKSRTEGEFISIDFTIPGWEGLKSLLHGNKDNYFILLKLTFEVIKKKARDKKYEISRQDLLEEFKKKFDSPELLADITLVHTKKIMERIRQLKEEYGDGRLIKTLEDLVLAGVLKNYFLYDYVVGNPPYVRVQTLPDEVKERLKGSYATVVGKFDIYIPFIERGITWLNESGNLGYINPNLFFNRDYGKNLRKFITSNCRILQIIDFGDSGVFKDATNYPCIIILKKTEADTRKNILKAVTIRNPKDNILIHIKHDFLKSFYQDEYYTIFEIEQSELEQDSWKLAPQKILKIFEKIEKTQLRLKELTEEIYEGFITGANEVYFIDKSSAEKLKLENELLKRVPKGRNVRKWKFAIEQKYVIYPHESGNGKTLPISNSELRSKYPHVMEYFEANSSKLRKREYLMEAIENGQRQEWYEIWNPRNFDWFNQPKIITPNLSTENNFAFDEEGYFLDHDCYGIILKDKERNNYLFVLGLLNSKVLEFYLKQISPFASGKYYRYMTGYLERLPIKLPQTKEEQKLANEITSLVEKILSLAKVEQRVASFPEHYFEELKQEIEEWDEISWRAKRSYKSIEPIVEEGAIILGKSDEIRDSKINSETKQKYVIEALKGKTISKDKEVKIRLPRSDGVVKKILKRLEGGRAKLKEKPIAELEDEINERVYKLYGLNENDIKVIKDFLERF